MKRRSFFAQAITVLGSLVLPIPVRAKPDQELTVPIAIHTTGAGSDKDVVICDITWTIGGKEIKKSCLIERG